MKNHIKKSNILWMLLVITITLIILVIFYLKPDDNSIVLEYTNTKESIKIDKNESLYSEKKQASNFNSKSNEKSEVTSFFKEIFKNGGNYETVAQMFISGKIKELNFSEKDTQDICNKTLPFIKYETTKALFDTCKPSNFDASINLINSHLLNHDKSVDQEQIIKKLDLYKNNGLLVTDVEYYIDNYSEKTNVYEKSVAMGFTKVMDYLEKNGLHSTNQNLIDIQLDGRPSLDTINYLIKKGYPISESSKQNFLNNNYNEKKYPEIYKVIQGI